MPGEDLEARLRALGDVVSELREPWPLAQLLVGRLRQLRAPDDLCAAAHRLAEQVRLRFE